MYLGSSKHFKTCDLKVKYRWKYEELNEMFQQFVKEATPIIQVRNFITFNVVKKDLFWHIYNLFIFKTTSCFR